MTQNDFIFTDKAQYNPATVEVGFNPVQAADITPLLEKNRDILSDNFKRHQEAEERNIERDNEAKRLADDANATRLMEFSDKLTGLIKTGLDIHKKNVTAELEIWALNNRDELLQSYANKNELESKALAGASLAQGLSAEAEAKGASSPVIKKLEDLGGWRKVVVNRVLLQKAGIDYPNFRASAEAKEISLIRLDESKPKVKGPDGVWNYPPLLTADGQPQTYSIVSAVGPAENAAIIKAIQTAYVGKYAGMGTLADRHELLWKKIEEHEDSITAANGLEAEKQLNEERKTYINNQILVAANHSPEQFGKKLQELVTLYSQRFNGPKGAASKFMIAFKKAVEDGKIPHDTARVLLEKTTMLDNSSGKTVLLKDHPMFKNLIKENDIDTVIQNARGKEHQKKALKIQSDSEELKTEMIEVEIPKIVKEKGHITESDLLTLELAWMKDPRGGGAGIEFPLKNYATVQDQDDKAAMALAERFKELNRGFITKAQASRLPEHIRKKYEDAGVIKDNLTASSANLSLAEKYAHGLAKDYYQGYDPGAPTSTQLDYLTQAKLAYEQEYARLRGLNLDEKQAHDGAIQHLKDNSNSYAIKPPRGSTTAALTKLYNVGEALKKNVNTDGHTDFTVKIEGLEHEIAELDKIALAGGGKLPAIFHNATRDYKMPGWQNAAWALARAQYKAYTGKDLIAPDGVSLNSAAAQERKLLNHKNTNAGTNRVIIQTGDNEASVEKEGGIAKETSEMTQNDFLSMIESPYKDTQRTDIYDKGLTIDAMLSAKDFNQEGALSGHYQLSSSQIREGIKDLKKQGIEIDTNSPFTLDIERQIFLNRLNNKLRHNNNKYAGLTERFPALSILNTEQLKQWDTIVDSEDNSIVAKGPFNKSSNVLPNLINIK